MPQHTPPPSVLFESFTFQYRAQKEPTLFDINVRIQPGEKVLIVGPSGSGKSTLAHCINGLVPHAYPGHIQGRLDLFGEDSRSKSIFDISKRVGTVLQDTDGQFVGLSAGEDIAFSLENDCVDQAQMIRRVREVAQLVSIDQQLGQAPQQLSGGQKQRVSVAGVLIDDVDLLLFDEPLANLDPQAGVHAIDLIDRLHQQAQKTILIIEHRLEDALHRPVDRILVIHQGRIVSDTPPQTLLSGHLLREIGIREPLYVTALRYAGVTITEASQPQHIDQVDLSAGDPAPATRLKAWDTGLPPAPEAPATNVLLDCRHLSFYYPEDLSQRPVIRDVSLRIHEGEAVSLVGRNGAGKTTLAKLICGFETPQAGHLIYQGQDMAGDSIRERAERIGYIMQNPNQMISLPMVFDEAALGLRVRGLPDATIRARVHETLDICGLYPFRKWPVSALSYGQKKRLTIAAILVLQPKVLILDEPTAGQDFYHYTRIMQFLETLRQAMGLSLLMITHDMHLMLEYTSRAIVLSDAVKLADDTPANVLTDDALIEAASLKRTSLYDLAVRSGLKDPRGFVQRFISYDREVRAHEPDDADLP